MDTIPSFDGKYRFLSNFYPAEIVWGGLRYPTSEHLYHAMKAATEAGREWVRAAPTAASAKSRGRQIKRVGGWGAKRVDVMRTVLLAKFGQHPKLAAKLIATGDAELVEGNTWGDTFWGRDLATGRGDNRLGKLLMELRGTLETTDAAA